MDRGAAATADASAIPDTPARSGGGEHEPLEAERATAAGRAAMQVAWLGRISTAGVEQRSDRIRILIPGDAGVLVVKYRSAEDRPERALLRAPQVCVILARQPHALCCQRQSDLVVIGLDRSFYEKWVGTAFATQAPLLGARYGAMDHFLWEVGRNLRIEHRSQRIHGAAYWEALAGVIAVHLARTYGEGAATIPSPGLSPHKLDCVLAFAEEHLAEPIQVEQLAAAAHLSPHHFARMFKQATGQSPHAYITEHRVERAKTLLEDNTVPLVAVAASVGFQTQSHFTEVFHRYTGSTPRRFRLRRCGDARIKR